MPAVDTDEYTSLYTTTKTASSQAYQEIKTMSLLGDVPIGARSADDLTSFARSLKNRPRETLGSMKPSERLAELLALTG